MGFEEGGAGGGAGDVAGPSVSVDGEVVLFSGTTGKLVKAGTASGTDCLTIGPGASGTKEDICIGDTATATHPNGDCVIVGFNASASRGDGVCVGHTARGTGTGSNYVAIGSGATATAGNSVAVGQGATAAEDATALGAGATAGTKGTCVGRNSQGAGSNVAVGVDATAITFGHCQAYGRAATATAPNQVVFGSTTSPVIEFQTGVTANGASLSVRSSSQLVATTSGATASTTGGLIPAGASVLAVSARVTTAVTTSGGTDTWSLGDSDPDRYGSVAGALGTTLTAADYTADPAGVWSSTARELVLDAAGAETFTAGAVRVVVHYTLPNPPTS